jgi:hypothetical protein
MRTHIASFAAGSIVGALCMLLLVADAFATFEPPTFLEGDES